MLATAVLVLLAALLPAAAIAGRSRTPSLTVAVTATGPVSVDAVGVVKHANGAWRVRLQEKVGRRWLSRGSVPISHGSFEVTWASRTTKATYVVRVVLVHAGRIQRTGRALQVSYTAPAPQADPATDPSLADVPVDAAATGTAPAATPAPAAAAVTAAAVTPPSTLSAGAHLASGDKLVSPDGNLRLAMQTDGNLVLYQGTKVLWNSGTGGHAGATATLQTDGNFVVYFSSKALWSTKTDGTGADRLTLQNDGNLVLYKGSTAKWATYTTATKVTATPTPTPAPAATAAPTPTPSPTPAPPKATPKPAPSATNADDYPYKKYDGPGSNPGAFKWMDPTGRTPYSQFSYSFRNCTDFAAWYLHTKGVATPRLSGLGNGGTWGPRAQSRGIKVNSTPSVGSIAWLKVSPAHPYGHVAVVQSVSKGTVTVAEYNVLIRGGFDHRTVATSTFSGYIHFF